MTSGFLNQPWRRWLVLPVVFLLVDGLLLASISLGIRFPGFGLIAAIADITGFDYDHHGDTRFSPLSDEFLARTLGFRAANGGTPAAGAASRSGNRAASLSSIPNRVVLNHPFTNDNFADAIEVPSIPFTAKTNTTGATTEAGEPKGCAPVNSGTVWYRFRPTQDFTLAADTYGTTYALSLAVFTGSFVDHLQQVGCQSATFGNAQLIFAATHGTTYYVQITATTGGGALTFNLARLGATRMIDTAADGSPANTGVLNQPSVSASGRYVVFDSEASNIAPGNAADSCTTSACTAIFLRDLVAGTTELIVAGKKAQPSTPASTDAGSVVNYSVKHPMISGDGRFIAFDSNRPDLVPDDTNGVFDVFTYDRVAKHFDRDSVSSTGQQATTNPATSAPVVEAEYEDVGSTTPSISADGRVVTFTSDASNLASNDANGAPDVFAHDRVVGTTELVSVGPGSRQFANARSRTGEAVSADGNVVAFEATHDQCQSTPVPSRDVPAQRNPCFTSVFVRDRAARRTIGVSHGNEYTTTPSISSDGRHVVFESTYALVPEDTNGGADFYVFDTLTQRNKMASVTSANKQSAQANTSGGGGLPRSSSISDDGRFVVFSSTARDLTPNKGQAVYDIYVHDMVTGATTLESVTKDGLGGDGDSIAPALAADGSLVVFLSHASNFEDATATQPRSVRDVFAHENELAR
jgi:Tol biopolymer transport system component